MIMTSSASATGQKTLTNRNTCNIYVNIPLSPGRTTHSALSLKDGPVKLMYAYDNPVTRMP